MPPGEVSLADVIVELRAIRESVARPAELSLLLGHDEGWAYLGVSKAAWFRLLAAGVVTVVDVPGTGPRVRRADLEKLVEKLKPRRRPRRPAKEPAAG